MTTNGNPEKPDPLTRIAAALERIAEALEDRAPPPLTVKEWVEREEGRQARMDEVFAAYLRRTGEGRRA